MAMPISRNVARFASSTLSPRERHKMTTSKQIAASNAGTSPAVKSAPIDTPVTEPIMISTRLGGIVSAIAPAEASIATRSFGSDPRRRISGKSTGATAAISAVFEPEIPETTYIANTSTMPSPPRK